MIYTCYEMARDCRSDRPEGWSYFVANYVPVARKLVAHYGSDDAGLVNRVLLGLRKPQSSLFQTLEPVPERWFLAELRQKVLAELDLPAAEIPVDLQTVAAALEPLTMVEKQAAWIESMRYGPEETGAMLRMSPQTVAKVCGRAPGLGRGKVDAWRRSLLADNGAALGREAAAAGGEDCLPPKTFLDILDGRMTWRGREELERHVTGCWHCIDHFCRMVEIIEMLRGARPLTEEESAPYRTLLGIQPLKTSAWKRLLGRR